MSKRRHASTCFCHFFHIKINECNANCITGIRQNLTPRGYDQRMTIGFPTLTHRGLMRSGLRRSQDIAPCFARAGA
jgi:hypothetical protein